MALLLMPYSLLELWRASGIQDFVQTFLFTSNILALILILVLVLWHPRYLFTPNIPILFNSEKFRDYGA